MSGLRAAVAAYNRAAAELVIARQLLHREMDADAVRRDRLRYPAPCGTRAGYHRHLREESVPCPACMEASNRYHRRLKRRAA